MDEVFFLVALNVFISIFFNYIFCIIRSNDIYSHFILFFFLPNSMLHIWRICFLIIINTILWSHVNQWCNKSNQFLSMAYFCQNNWWYHPKSNLAIIHLSKLLVTFKTEKKKTTHKRPKSLMLWNMNKRK